MGEHTPGPWGIRERPYDPEVVWEGGNAPYTIEAEGGWCVAKGGIQAGATMPNARLIAAAPEMLDALKEILFLANNATRDDIARAARTAIAKAEGR